MNQLRIPNLVPAKTSPSERRRPNAVLLETGVEDEILLLEIGVEDEILVDELLMEEVLVEVTGVLEGVLVEEVLVEVVEDLVLEDTIGW